MQPASTPPPKLAGIDISHYQTVTSWPTVAEQAKFCFVKATDGIKYVDPSLAPNVRGCSDHGIPVGLYHFFRGISGNDEANHFLESFSKHTSQLPPVLDIETNADNVVNEALIFLELVAAVVQPMVYTYSYFATTNLTADFTKYPLWIANTVGVATPSTHPWPSYSFWQWKIAIEFDGISGPVDMDLCIDQKTFDSLLRLPT